MPDKKKLLSIIIISLTLMLFGCSAQEVSRIEESTVPISENGILSAEQYNEIYQNRLSGSLLMSDSEEKNTYDYIKTFAPNDDLRKFEAADDYNSQKSTYYLSVYTCGKGKIALVFDSQGDKPNACLELIYYTQPVSADKLKTAGTLGDVYTLTSPENEDEFNKYCIAAENSAFFAPAEEGADNINLSLHLTDDGFYLVKYSDYMWGRSGDEITLNRELSVTLTEKCDSGFSAALYELITQ